MAKKRKTYYKKRYKGVRYVNRALKKYFGKRYPVGSDRLARARAITDQIKGAGDKVILKNIFAIERIPRKSRPAPRSEKPDTGPVHMPRAVISKCLNYSKYVRDC